MANASWFAHGKQLLYGNIAESCALVADFATEADCKRAASALNATMTLTLDEDDYATVQNAITERQLGSRRVAPTEATILPDGESCLAGAIIAELIRDLNDYRAMWEASHPT